VNGKELMMSSEINLNPTFGVNDYDRPKVLSTMESYVTDILMILFGKPGFYPSIPSLGMDIGSLLYKFEDEVSAEELKTELENQCHEFSKEIDTGDMDVVTTTYKNHLMIIFILPLIDDTKKVRLSLGVTTNNRGEIVYNFVENEEQII
jgi:hypothetical protein